MENDRHKVFISYFHADDVKYKKDLLRMNDDNGGTIFVDWSVNEDEVDDAGKTSERVRQIIRDDYIQDATVLILLCGEGTKGRKHIDWEIHAAMFNTDNNPKMGIIVINLPEINQSLRTGDITERELISPSSEWRSITSRQDYEESYQYMPIRIIDNFATGIDDPKITPIAVVNWSRIWERPFVLKQLIHNAFVRGKQNDLHYDHSRPLKGRNS